MSGVTLKETAKLRDIIELELCMELYRLCDDVQFEHCTPLDFANFLNLRPTNLPVVAKDRERLRICYIAYLLEQEIIPSRHGREWAVSFLDRIGIDEATYMKRRTNAADQKPFCEPIEKAIENWRKRRRGE